MIIRFIYMYEAVHGMNSVTVMEIAAALAWMLGEICIGHMYRFSNISPCDRTLVRWPLEVDCATLYLCAPWNMRCHETPIA